jgi:hypothetical protein
MAAMREIFIQKMRVFFGDDLPRIDHAINVLKYAEIIAPEVNARLDIVWAAAAFHDIGIHAAEQKHASTAGRFQELEGPPIARAILAGLGIPQADIDHICDIIANHHSGQFDSPEFRCIWDGDWIVNLEDDFKDCGNDFKKKIISRTMKTQTGKKLAAQTCKL